MPWSIRVEGHLLGQCQQSNQTHGRLWTRLPEMVDPTQEGPSGSAVEEELYT